MRSIAIIPAYNEAARLGPVVARARAEVDAVLVVDDGSKDGTAAAAEAAGAVVLRHETNQGKGMALRNGLDWAAERGYEALLTLDADGQHLPEEIPPFLEAFRKGADLAVGNRMSDLARMPWIRRCTNRVMSSVVSWLARAPVPDSQCGFRLLRAGAWQTVRPRLRTVGFDFESEILVQAGRLGLRIEAVPISTIYGDEQSKIHPLRDTLRFVRMVLRLLR